jgi:long-chain acyl-CoA synthetase
MGWESTMAEGASGKVRTLVELYREAVTREKADVFVCRSKDGQWRPVSSRELAMRVRSVAMGLASLGVGEESRVGLLSENRLEWIEADLGVLTCGAADVPIYPTHAPKQVTYILNDAGVEILFVSTVAQLARVRESLAQCPRLRTVILFDRPASDEETPRGGDWTVLSYADFLEQGRTADRAAPDHYDTLAAEVTPESVATLIYTSGTTGDPKGVVLTHQNLTTNVLINCRLAALRADERGLSFLPFSHIFERNWLYMYLHAGTSAYLAESVETVGRDLGEVRPHIMTSVPRLYEKFYARAMEKAMAGGAAKMAIARWAMEVGREWARVEDRGEAPGLALRLRQAIADRLVLSKWRMAMGGELRAMVSGGAALSPDLARVFFGAGLSIYQGYGLTETSPTITTNYPGLNRIGSVGRPIEGVEVQIAPDGEILCSGPNVMRGYFNKPDETAAVLTRDSAGRLWFHTGDIGHLDSDGFLYITDRKKDLLKTSGGKYIAPQPIENMIKRSRYVSQVVVIGDDRKFPAAILVPNFEALTQHATQIGLAALSPSELIQRPEIVKFLEAEVAAATIDLPQYERIKGILLLDRELTVESAELTPTLKVRRRVVTERLKEAIDRLYIEKEVSYRGREADQA